MIPRAEFSFSEFCARTPSRSVALDGFVKGGAAQNLQTRHFNYDHHAGCRRDITICTAQQIATAQSQGLMKLLCENDMTDFYVCKNDNDCDATGASFQLMHPELCDSLLFRRLLNGFIAPLDISAGTDGPDIHHDLMREGTWIFEPYFRELSNIYTMNGQQLVNLTLEMYGRIKDYLLSKGHLGTIECQMTELGRGDGWMMIQEHGALSRLKALQSNPTVKALVVYKAQTENSYRYSTVKRNQLTLFPLELFTEALNRAELFVERNNLESLADEITETTNRQSPVWRALASIDLPNDWTKPWGGGDAVIGCLRTKGSSLTPDIMRAFTDAFMRDLATKAYEVGCYSLTEPLIEVN
jgi:hypothetical protein